MGRLNSADPGGSLDVGDPGSNQYNHVNGGPVQLRRAVRGSRLLPVRVEAQWRTFDEIVARHRAADAKGQSEAEQQEQQAAVNFGTRDK
jgi:hypothetical protein